MDEPIFSPMLIGSVACFGFIVVRTVCFPLLWRVPAGTHDTQETTPLLAHSHAAKHLSHSTRFFCAFGAFVYLCLTMLAAFHVFLEYGKPAIHDPRFAIFRGGEFSYAVIVLLRTTFDSRYNEGPDMRADALSLVLLPWIMLLIQTPASSRLVFSALDWAVTPAIGIAIFWAGAYASQ
ncbi:hypothetical protein B0H13DRAFT_2380189 [Mycena leptocephala]|nr:hypothetical protein B0H13DRAFT_2380189 [Mycena leptocephala]